MMLPHYERRMLHTPFHARIAAACETNEWEHWKGYTTPASYTDVELEYFAIRNSCAVFDLTPMTKYRITGADAGEIDHIEVFGPPERPDADSKNFVLCPGKAYDRSPCGTGTSAKLACLAEDHELGAGEIWRQDSIVGSWFDATFREVDGGVLVTITGNAFVNADVKLILDPDDPYRHGLS